MDLIYTDTERNDVGVLKDYTFDLAYGSDENDFELTVDLYQHPCEAGCLVYIDRTEYGGIIDGLSVTTAEDRLVYKGRTWHGVLASKIIDPGGGNAYITVQGDANAVIAELLLIYGLSDLFTVSAVSSGIYIEHYQFDRYIDLYSGIVKMLETVSAKLKFSFNGGMVVISVEPIVDYSQDEQFDNDTVDMEIENVKYTVNHLICLGKGELEEREVIHLYLDASGNVSDTQTFFGIQEVTAVFDYPNVESSEELVKSGVVKLIEFANANKVQLNFTADEATYDVGDIIGAKEIVTGIVASEKITKKIVTINRGVVNIQYKVGE